jgi:hypothetical protein
MKKDKNLDELFRDKLLNYEQEPPAYLLGNILNRVGEERRKKRLIWWRVAGVAAALMIAFVAGWQLNNSRNQEINQPFVAAQKLNDIQEKLAQHETKPSQVKTELTANKDAIAVVTDSQKQTNQVAQISKNKTASNNQETIENTTTSNNLIALVPLKSLHTQLRSATESKDALRQTKKMENQQVLTEKTVDQQIMEHNRQMMVAENKSKEKTRWLVGAQVTPEYNVSRSSHNQQYASNMLASSSNSADLGGGISVELKKGKRWSIQSGIYYSGIDQSAKNRAVSEGKNSMDANTGSNYFNTTVNLSPSTNRMTMNSQAGVIELNKIPSGLVLGTSLEDKSFASSVIVSPTSFIQNFDYVEIPLYLRYTLIDTRIDVVMLGGFSSNLLVGNQIFVEDASGKSLVGKTQDMETMNYSGTVGVGFRYGLSKRISLNIEPRVKYYLKSLNSNSSVTYKPYTIGVFTGLSYEF